MSGKVFNYQNGKIYKLCCKDPTITEIYVGSTLNQYQRKAQHKKACNCPNTRMYNLPVYQFIRNHGGFDEWDLVVLEEYKAENKNDLLWKEREWIDKLLPTLNRVRPIISQDERKEYDINYREVNKEQNKEQCKKYRENNKEQIREMKKKHYESNKQKILEQVKQYREKNKEQISERRSEKVECEFCKISTSRYHLARHRKSQRHIRNEKIN